MYLHSDLPSPFCKRVFSPLFVGSPGISFILTPLPINPSCPDRVPYIPPFFRFFLHSEPLCLLRGVPILRFSAPWLASRANASRPVPISTPQTQLNLPAASLFLLLLNPPLPSSDLLPLHQVCVFFPPPSTNCDPPKLSSLYSTLSIIIIGLAAWCHPPSSNRAS